MCIAVSPCSFEHLLLHGLKKFAYPAYNIIEGNFDLLPCIPADENALACLDVLGTDLETKRISSHLCLGEFPSGSLVGIVNLDSCNFRKLIPEFISLVENAFLLLLDGNDAKLYGSNPGRKYKSLVVSVNHDERTDESGGHAP